LSIDYFANVHFSTSYPLYQLMYQLPRD